MDAPNNRLLVTFAFIGMVVTVPLWGPPYLVWLAWNKIRSS